METGTRETGFRNMRGEKLGDDWKSLQETIPSHRLFS